MNPQHLLCIDASNLLHRFFHGMPEMYSPTAGIHTHALTAWVNFLTGFQSRMPFLPVGTTPVVFFDRKRDLVADGIAAAPDGDTPPDPAAVIDYKGQRKPTDDKLVPQLQMAEHITSLLGVAHVKETGHEADTLLGAVVINHQQNHDTPARTVHILSTDKDMLQLVSDQAACLIRGVHPQPGGLFKVLDEKSVAEKMGVPPNQVADLLAMMGDTCDNIPGIPGVGQKTAIGLLQTYGSLQGVVDNADKIPGKLGEKIRKHLPYIPALRKLVTFEPKVVRIRQSERQNKAVRDLLTHLDMHRTLQKIGI